MLAPWKKSIDKPRQHIKKQRHHFANKGLYSQSYGFFLDLRDKVPDELWTEIHDIVQETGIKTISMEKKCKKAKWLLRRPYK